MVTYLTITYRESYLSRLDVVRLFFAVAGATTDSEEIRSYAKGSVSFRIYGFYNRVIETTLANRITAIDALAEVRINGQPHSFRARL
jgi:hypothetical protein